MNWSADHYYDDLWWFRSSHLSYASIYSMRIRANVYPRNFDWIPIQIVSIFRVDHRRMQLQLTNNKYCSMVSIDQLYWTNASTRWVLIVCSSFLPCCMFWLQAMFSVVSPHRDIYLVVRVERCLSLGDHRQCCSLLHLSVSHLESTIDGYMKSDVKTTAKLQKIVSSSSYSKLINYRAPFAWTARFVVVHELVDCFLTI
jgi:hypothetical protein